MLTHSFTLWVGWQKESREKAQVHGGLCGWILWRVEWQGLKLNNPSFDSVWERAVGQPYLNNSRWCPSTWDIFCWWKPTSWWTMIRPCDKQSTYQSGVGRWRWSAKYMVHPNRARIVSRVKKTGRNRSGNRGYRSNRPGPVPVPAGFKPAQIQILNLNFKTWKNPKKFLKILQVATNLMVSNFFKYSFI